MSISQPHEGTAPRNQITEQSLSGAVLGHWQLLLAPMAYALV